MSNTVRLSASEKPRPFSTSALSGGWARNPGSNHARLNHNCRSRQSSIVKRGMAAADGRVRGAAALREQLLVAGEPGDDVRPVRVEETLEQERLVRVGQLVGRLLRGNLVGVLRPGGQVVELPEQHGGEVERGVDARITLQRRGHVVVILGGVHARPGPGVNARVLVVQGLVLVPDQVEVQDLLGGCACRGVRGERDGDRQDEAGAAHGILPPGQSPFTEPRVSPEISHFDV